MDSVYLWYYGTTSQPTQKQEQQVEAEGTCSRFMCVGKGWGKLSGEAAT